jgi:predicted subunit of tRNA(5-methylaminomethyl-2-thiouridylate) methyltransferase
MKVGVLYSGGKDSSLIAVILKNMGFKVELLTANFGVFDSYINAYNSSKILNMQHEIIKLDKKILENGVNLIIDDGFPNNGINYIHKTVIEEIADTNKYEIIADGTRRDDKVPKLNKNEIQSLEDRKNIQYINLDSFGYKTIETLVSKFFEIKSEESNQENSSDYEVEIRCLIDKIGGNSDHIFPKHYQTQLVALKCGSSKL